MSVPKKNTAILAADEVTEAFLEGAAKLLKKHGIEIVQLVEESENAKANVAFSCAIDNSESEPSVTTKIRFSRIVTDSQVKKIDNPDQGVLFKRKIEPKATEQPVGKIEGGPKVETAEDEHTTKIKKGDKKK
jgi:hypothetical protein